MRCSWLSFMLLLLFMFSFNGVSGGRHRKQHHSAAIVVGTVYCDTCFRQELSKSTHFISGATVAVECGGDGLKSFRQEVKTNEKGEFEAKLPVSVGKHVDRIKKCSIKLVSSSEPYCAVAATATSSEIRFKSKKAGKHVFSAGFFTFKPELCSQKDVIGKGFPPALPDPATPFLPPIGEGILPPLPVPDLPVPPLVPPVPRIPGIPIPPVTRQKPSESDNFSDQKTFGFPFPPNPFQPPTLPPLPFVPSPPSLFPPLPFQPSPPSLIPPLIPSPPPASLFPPLIPFPPLPGVIPSPPPPPPPAFPIPLPPLPPVPRIPIPPASNHP
ncbi:U1 small nuclear ribonucleoprotein C [Cynara cardunculus var. scolymus]|uniref:Pollen Ole e 1 allergen/extensin n=1 Tax=Cynara cardunculus var. scolymus TaxID=59895 RepID=A0A103XLA6_CYNCS|nr:U1 small nuclear ribonucleoprotein C [Cynara cardunculus var. scolymus]KVH92639.1 Pollen Ole e 1 allergen/extensin [Cynara cardunculus var. scolymus]